MFLTLLYVHLIAVAMIFAGIGIEVAAFIALHRAQRAEHVRAALSNTPFIGPLMGIGVLLLVVAGVGMVYMGGFGWQPWALVALIVTILLAMNGPMTNGKRTEALARLAQSTADGPIDGALEIARRDRVLNYSVFLTAFELVAVLYLMSNKPGPAGSVLAVVIAAIVALVPMALVTRPTTSRAGAYADEARSL